MDANTLISQARELASTASPTERKKLVNELRDLAISLEEPVDAVRRLAYSQIQVAVAKIASDLNLWNISSGKSERGCSTDELALEVGADPVFMGRLLRYLASHCMIKEISQDKWGPTNVSEAFTIPGLQACLSYTFPAFGQPIQELPGFMAETSYNNPTGMTTSPFQRGNKTQLTMFQWMKTRPTHHENFSKWMTAHRHEVPSWLSVYPLMEECKNTKDSEIVFVDVGAGIGHQCRLLKETFPDLKGRVICEDLEETLKGVVEPCEGVEYIPQDFFQPQVVKGAKYYYLRSILHDYPDSQCIQILQQIAAAMSPTSRILIDEFVIPNTGVSWQDTTADMTMLIALAGMERTEMQWVTLLKEAGLIVDRFVNYGGGVRDVSVIVAGKV